MFESLAFLFYALLALLGLICAFLIVQAVYPRFTWVLVKWQYRNPEMMEPSAIVFQYRRIKALVLFAIFLVALVVLVNARGVVLGT